ncbi:restriction endonuclease subunit S [Polaribacter sp. 11A2H]|uniref:restriction endonuclease subunit S n=1 Tax=Polaribacter sp. 11A2H TaxID=2687290 RepID=UPI00140BB3DF|nr:restriction endonuclease subunit S [Polaribacter sp. 11A2H]
MVKKYTDNYRLDIAYATIFREIKPIEELLIHSVLDITSGDNLTKSNMVPGEHIVYGGGGTTNKKHHKFNIDYKTIGIGRVGARCGCVFEIKKNSWVTDNALLIQSFDERFSLNFLRHFLAFSNLGQFANNAMQPVISKTRIKNILIPLIPLEEQEELSKILDAIESNIKFKNIKYKKIISKIEIIDNWELLNTEIESQKHYLSQLKQSILQEAIQGKLTEDWRVNNPELISGSNSATALLKRIKVEKAQLIKDKNIKKEKPLPNIIKEDVHFQLPESWVWTRLGDICNNITSGSTPSKDSFLSNEIPYLKVYNIRNQEIDFKYKPQFIKQAVHESSLKRCILKPGDVVMNIVGPPLGKVAIIPEDYPEWNCNQAISIFRCINSSINQFIYQYLCAGLYLDYLHYKGMAGQDNISVTMCKELVIGLPPLSEQKEIVKKVKQLMVQCQQLEQEITKSEANAQMLMQAVLKEAFSNS